MVSLACFFLLFSQAAESEAAISLKISHCVPFLYLFRLGVGVRSPAKRAMVKFTAMFIFGIVAWPEGEKPFGDCWLVLLLRGGRLLGVVEATNSHCHGDAS